MSTYLYSKRPTAALGRPANYGIQAIDSFTMEALNTVITSIPEWHILLENLDGQIDLRQAELAALGDDRPPTRSLKPQGSMESLLRPNETDEPEPEGTMAAGPPNQPPNLPSRAEETAIPKPSTPERKAEPRPLSGSPPQPFQRRTSQRLNTPNYAARTKFPTVLRKRKTESVNSGESLAPKYRTRSMIIVYYDSAVQYAFEELVKLISASRNAMRKGKMAARMADMKRMAELNADSSSDEDESPTPESSSGVAAGGEQNIIAADPAADEDEINPPRLEFVSTRQMGPSRDSAAMAAYRSNGHMMRLGGGAGRGRPHPPGAGDPSGTAGAVSCASIFDELDSGLEWCQSMCEHAAHQFLRDGTCRVEIEGVKSRLAEVKVIAERQEGKVAAAAAEKLRAAEALVSPAGRPEERRGMKKIQMRKSVTPTPTKFVDAGQLEVDDEGYDEEMPTLQWRSARQRIS